MKEFVAFTAAALAAVAFVFVLREMFAARMPSRDPGVFSSVVIVVLGGLLYEARIIPPGQLSQICFFLSLVGCLIISITRGARAGRVDRQPGLQIAAFLPAAISLALFLVNALMNPALPLSQSFGRLLSVSVVLILGLLFISGLVALDDICRIIIGSVLVIVMISPAVGQAWRPCDIFKCGPFGGIYTGPFSSENAFAIYACVAILCALKIESRRLSAFVIMPLALVLYATESRTSQIALGCALAAVLVLRFWRAVRKLPQVHVRQPNQPLSGGQLAFFSLVTITLTALGYYLIIHAEPASFSNRGGIWLRGMAALGENWLSGLGLDRWTFLQTIGLLPQLFPHSQYLLMLFGGGLTAVILMVMMLIGSIIKSRASDGDATFAVAYTTFLSVLGLTEAYWNPATFDGHTMLIVPLLILLAKQTRSSDGAGRQVRPAREHRLSDSRRSFI